MLEGLKAYFTGTQTPEEAEAQRQRERAWEAQYGGSTAGLETPIVDPIDSLAGGVTMLPKGLLAALSEVGSDALIGLALDAQAEDEYLRAAFIGPKGIRALGRDASKDLFGQWSAIHDRNVRLEVQDPVYSAFDVDEAKYVKEGGRINLADTIDLEGSDNTILQAYPELQGYDVVPYIDKEDWKHRFTSGYHDARRKEIGVTALNPADEYVRGAKQQQRVQAHEVQHAIDQIEGFPRGGSPDENWASVRQNLIFNPETAALKKEYEDAQLRALKSPTKSNKAKAEDALNKYSESQERINRTVANIDPKKGGENYRRLAGEEQARDAAFRYGLSPEARSRIQPYSGAIPSLYTGKMTSSYNQAPLRVEDLIIDYRPTGKIEGSKSLSIEDIPLD